MKKLNLLFALFFLSAIANAQIKIWPGGDISVGTTTNAPGWPNRTLFWGPVNIQQSNYDQHLLRLDAVNQPEFGYSMQTILFQPLVKNYAIHTEGVSPWDPFFVYGNGDVISRGSLLYSDSTLKTQITTLDSALYKILQLRGVHYKYKADIADTSIHGGTNAKLRLGLIAQEVQAVLPEAVDTTDAGIMGINYANLAGLFIEGIKDLNTKVETNNHWKLDSLNNVYRDTLNVGIGTAYPGDKLTVNGTFSKEHSYAGQRYYLYSNNAAHGLAVTGPTGFADLRSYLTLDGGQTVIWQKDSTGSGKADGLILRGTSPGLELVHQHGAFDLSRLGVGDDGVYVYGRFNERSDPAFTVKDSMGVNTLLKVQCDGRMAIGTSTPVAQLSVINFSSGAAPTIAGFFDAQGGYNNYGVKAYAPIDSNNYAGYFQGDVVTTGTYYTVSDERAKTNIATYEVNALDKIKSLTVKTYEFNPAMQAKHNLPHGSQIGIMAQDVEKQWPGLVRNGQLMVYTNPKDTLAKPSFEDFKVVNYTGLIPVLVKGMQELAVQPAKTDSLLEVVKKVQAENTLLKDRLTAIEDKLLKFDSDLQFCCFNHNNQTEPAPTEGSKLEQNTPNPFSENTTIRYYVAAKSASAVIRIVKQDGTVVSTFKIDAKGAGQILLSGNSLTAGTYIYELIIDGKQVDYKRMVLTY